MPKITSFFSYKGGVGRTALLYRTAHEIYNNLNQRVCCLDFDLEAPGFPQFFEEGLTDTSLHYSLTEQNFNDLSREATGNIAALSTRVANLGPAQIAEICSLFERAEGKGNINQTINNLLSEVVNPNHYAHLLIDNRTGLITRVYNIFGLSDNIVFVFRPDHQNETILKELFIPYIDQIRHGSSTKIAVVISMVPVMKNSKYFNLDSFLTESGLKTFINEKNLEIFIIPFYAPAFYDEHKIIEHKSDQFLKLAEFLAK